MHFSKSNRNIIFFLRDRLKNKLNYFKNILVRHLRNKNGCNVKTEKHSNSQIKDK